MKTIKDKKEELMKDIPLAENIVSTMSLQFFEEMIELIPHEKTRKKMKITLEECRDILETEEVKNECSERKSKGFVKRRPVAHRYDENGFVSGNKKQNGDEI